jgi:hypothetical protein
MASQAAQKKTTKKRMTSTEASSLPHVRAAVQSPQACTTVHAQRVPPWASTPSSNARHPNNGTTTRTTVPPLWRRAAATNSSTTKMAVSARARALTPLVKPSSTTFSARTDQAPSLARVWRGRHISSRGARRICLTLCTSNSNSCLLDGISLELSLLSLLGSWLGSARLTGTTLRMT